MTFESTSTCRPTHLNKYYLEYSTVYKMSFKYVTRSYLKVKEKDQCEKIGGRKV